jgi:hypothetical protein
MGTTVRLETEEDIAKWIADRKRKWPSSKNAELQVSRDLSLLCSYYLAVRTCGRIADMAGPTNSASERPNVAPTKRLPLQTSLWLMAAYTLAEAEVEVEVGVVLPGTLAIAAVLQAGAARMSLAGHTSPKERARQAKTTDGYVRRCSPIPRCRNRPTMLERDMPWTTMMRTTTTKKRLLVLRQSCLLGRERAIDLWQTEGPALSKGEPMEAGPAHETRTISPVTMSMTMTIMGRLRLSLRGAVGS